MRRLFGGMALGAVLLTGCGSDDGGQQASSPTATTTTAAPATQASDRCEAVSGVLVAAIKAGLTVTGGTLRNAKAVRSKDFEKVWMVAADIQGSGMEGSEDIGVWATNSLQGDGLVFAIDGFAQEFSDWGHGDTTDANITQAADGVQEAKDCVQRKG
jgi:hypothetical protein